MRRIDITIHYLHVKLKADEFRGIGELFLEYTTSLLIYIEADANRL